MEIRKNILVVATQPQRFLEQISFANSVYYIKENINIYFFRDGSLSISNKKSRYKLRKIARNVLCMYTRSDNSSELHIDYVKWI